MKSFKDLIKKQPRMNKEMDEKTTFHLVSLVMEEEFGRVGKNKIKPSFLKERRLFLEAESSAWVQEIWLHRKELTEKINVKAGEEILKEIKIKVAKS